MVSGLLKTRVYSKRHYVIVMAFAIVLVVSGFLSEPYIKSYFYSVSETSDSTTKDSNQVKSVYSRSAPTRLVIPSINVDTSFVAPLNLLPDKTVSVPDSYTKVGWYSGGSTPGEIGPAVILGHVDSVSGPAVFYSLGQVKVGDEIKVTRADGSVATFSVTKLERVPQSDFPTLAVYGPTDKAALRLVTCTGIFNKSKQRYSHNLIVYAELK